MGVFIKAVTDGFRRCGIAHRAKGTFYPDGRFTEEQLEVFRKEPQLVVVEQDDPDDEVGDSVLLQEMGDTIVSLEHQLSLANDQYDAASVLLAALREQQLAAPGLIVGAVRALEPADPAAPGVILIAEDTLAEIISQHLQTIPGAEHDGSESTHDNSGGTETSQSAPPAAPVSPNPGPDADVVKGDKPASKRGAADKAGKKDAAE